MFVDVNVRYALWPNFPELDKDDVTLLVATFTAQNNGLDAIIN